MQRCVQQQLPAAGPACGYTSCRWDPQQQRLAASTHAVTAGLPQKSSSPGLFRKLFSCFGDPGAGEFEVVVDARGAPATSQVSAAAMS
jgi:hypothetical protein